MSATPKTARPHHPRWLGYAPPSPANAISLACKPDYDGLLAEFPNTLIHQSEVDRVEAGPPLGRAGGAGRLPNRPGENKIRTNVRNRFSFP